MKAASFSESKSKSEGGESKTEMDGLVLDDGAEVENRFQWGQALYLNHDSKNMCAIKFLDVGWMMFFKKMMPSSPCLVQWNWPHTDQW